MSSQDMPTSSANDEGKSQPKAPNAYLKALLQRIKVHAEVMRHHLGVRTQHHAVGLSAETGVRDVLRQVFPSRIAITSGFMCKGRGALIDAPEGEGVSPQTDVLLYDGSYACPLYRMNEIEVLEAIHALGFIEVKDWKEGEDALTDKKGQSLNHLKKLAAHAPSAFRAIVLLRGDETLKERAHIEKAYDICKNFEDKVGLGTKAPHLIYCVDKYYLAVYDYLGHALHFLKYPDEESALASFLYLLTGYFSVQGITAGSSSLEHESDPIQFGDKPLELKLKGRKPLESFADYLLKHPSGDGGPKPFDQRLKDWEKDTGNAAIRFHCFPSLGRLRNGRFSAGIAMVVSWKEKDKPELQYRGSFFAPGSQKSMLQCQDQQVQSQKAWTIPNESPIAYLTRALTSDDIRPEEPAWDTDNPTGTDRSGTDREEE